MTASKTATNNNQQYQNLQENAEIAMTTLDK